MSCSNLPDDVRSLFPKENLEFASTVTEKEAAVLKVVFADHDCFERVGEMIEAVTAKSPELGDRMKKVLDKNCERLNGLSPAAIEYSKKIIHFVTNVMCHLALGKGICLEKAPELHQQFSLLPAEDRAALKKNNPDIAF